MLVLFGPHAANSAAASSAGLLTAAPNMNGVMPAIYAIGTGMDFGHGGVFPHHPHHQHLNFTSPSSMIDVSSKLGAPLKQTSSPKHHSNSSSASSSSSITGSPRRTAANSTSATTMAYNNRYKTELCRTFVATGQCPYKEKCQYAHGKDELRNIPRHPKHKTEKCRSFHSYGFCNYGERCDFIHNEPSDPIDESPSTITPRFTAALGHQQQQHHLQSGVWNAGSLANEMMVNNRLWTAPTSSSNHQHHRRSSPVASLTIPESMIGGQNVVVPAFINSLGSVCSSSSRTSGIDSPLPSTSSSGDEQSPLSFSPDLMAQQQGGESTTIDPYTPYYLHHHHISASAMFHSTTPRPEYINFDHNLAAAITSSVKLGGGGGGDSSSPPCFVPMARRVFAYSIDSNGSDQTTTTTSSIDQQHDFSQHSTSSPDTFKMFSSLSPHQQQQQQPADDDLHQLIANFSQLKSCRLDSNRDQSPSILDSPERRLPTFALLTNQSDEDGLDQSSAWIRDQHEF